MVAAENGVAELYLTVRSPLPAIMQRINSGYPAPAAVFAALIGPVRYFVFSFVWRFVTGPVAHAWWAGLTGYFIGLAATGRYHWYQVAWIGLVIAAVLHGLNDWSRVNGHPAWILVVVVSGVLFLGCAKAGAQPTLAAPAGLGRPGRPWWEHR